MNKLIIAIALAAALTGCAWNPTPEGSALMMQNLQGINNRAMENLYRPAPLPIHCYSYGANTTCY